MKGLQLTADLYRCRCDAAWLTDAPRLEAWCRGAAEALGLRPLGQLFLADAEPGRAGLAATLLLSGGHLCLHARAEERSVSCDVYLSDGNGDPTQGARALMSALVDRFQPEWTEQRSLDRGEEE